MTETIIYHTIENKETWGDGPWVDEPDKMQWEDDFTGMPCLAVRHQYSGHWCGYVGVYPGHPLFGKHYETPDVDVHGGLTFANSCNDTGNESEDICHIAGPGEPDHVWWFGFDCAHAWDFMPAHEKRMSEFESGRKVLALNPREDIYRDLPYVQDQCASLAKQLQVKQLTP